MIKIITGIRRVGKSYLLKEIYKDYLLKDTVSRDQIIMLDLEEAKNAKYRNPFEMDTYINGKNEKRQSYRKQLEIDFVVNAENDKYYIHSAINASSEEKKQTRKDTFVKCKRVIS